ncbi:hypothetical protein BSKO_05581 [Bryopsis sp. KO-2023]|nr:hypothetical protein BSKO_05581 [Bryopsis sp. KO-2023]
MLRTPTTAKIAVLASVLFSFAHCTLSIEVLFVDSSSNLQASLPDKLSTTGLSGSLSGLLGVPPIFLVDKVVSDEISSVVSSDFLSRPRVVWSIGLVGVSREDKAASGLAGISTEPTFVTLTESDPHGVLLAIHATASSVDSPSKLLVLNGGASSLCGDTCLDVALKELAQTLGGDYTMSDRPMHGKLTLGENSFELTTASAQLWAREVSGVWESLKRSLPSAEFPLFVDTIMMGLQLVRADYGSDSEAFEFVSKFTAGLIKEGNVVLDEGGIVTAVAFMGDVDETSSLKQRGLIEAVVAHRRRILQVTESTQENTVASNQSEKINSFNRKAAAYGISIILFFFLMGGLYVMTNMDFKQDTLLYSRAKVD